jgi:antitoxin component YwqK of YwqJK toxin-antitoxin module
MHHKGGYSLSQLYYENGILRSSGINYNPMIELGRDTVIYKGDTSVIIEMSNTLRIGIWQYYDENGELIVEELYDNDGALIERRYIMSD